MLSYLIGQTGLNMALFRLIHMTYIIVSFRGKELTEGQHKYGQTYKGRAERRTERHADRQIGWTDVRTDGCLG